MHIAEHMETFLESTWEEGRRGSIAPHNPQSRTQGGTGPCTGSPALGPVPWMGSPQAVPSIAAAARLAKLLELHHIPAQAPSEHTRLAVTEPKIWARKGLELRAGNYSPAFCFPEKLHVL